MQRLSDIPDLHSLHMATNGVETAPVIPKLQAINLAGVNLSLDTLRPKRFQRVTRRNCFSHMQASLTALLKSAIPLKINTMAQYGLNDDGTGDIPSLARRHPRRRAHLSPACDNSVMDCFAIRFKDIRSDAPFEISGESRAGIPFESEVVGATTVRINTGALVPACVDTVVPVEACEETSGSIRLTAPVKPGLHIREKARNLNPAICCSNPEQPLNRRKWRCWRFSGWQRLRFFSRHG